MTTGEPFLISNLQGGHALRQCLTGRGQQQAIGAEGLCDAFAEVDGRFTRCPSLQVPIVRAGRPPEMWIRSRAEAEPPLCV